MRKTNSYVSTAKKPSQLFVPAPTRLVYVLTTDGGVWLRPELVADVFWEVIASEIQVGVRMTSGLVHITKRFPSSPSWRIDGERECRALIEHIFQDEGEG